MIQVSGRIMTRHQKAACVAAAMRPDNLNSLTTIAENDRVTTTITGTQIRTIIASVDDYLMNLAIAEDACSVLSQKTQKLTVQRPGKTRNQRKFRLPEKDTGE